MHNMLLFASNYRAAIDTITVDKALKLWKFELDDDNWQAVEDLVSVLSVHYGDMSCCGMRAQTTLNIRCRKV